jgi:O-methyltransferase
VTEAVTTRNSSSWFLRKVRSVFRPIMSADYKSDGLAVKYRNLSFMSDPAFVSAWNDAVRLNQEGWAKNKRGVPDVRWRAHICCWAAQSVLDLDGDFVECGVHTGLMSLTVAKYLNFQSSHKKFWLFDTFSGIPIERLDGKEREMAEGFNTRTYFDVLEIAKRNFSQFHNAHIVQGVLPQSLATVEIDKICYLSVDLNNTIAEKETIEALWPRVVRGGMIVLDDYGFKGHEAQHEMWNDFARRNGRMIATLPTGQGLLIK